MNEYDELPKEEQEKLIRFLEKIQAVFLEFGGNGLETINMETVFAKIRVERIRQDEKWGVQNHNDMYWLAILAEEFGEVAKTIVDGSESNRKVELIQAAAVLVAWLEQIEREQIKTIVDKET